MWLTPLELDVSSCGGSKLKALKNLKEAVRLFLEEAEKMGTLEQILEEAGEARWLGGGGGFEGRYLERRLNWMRC
jgi:hypothetical protein